MSAAALATSASRPLPSITGAPIASRWPLIAAALVIASAFFISEHNVRVSLAEAYTQSAEEMQVTAAGGNSLRRIMFLGIAAFGLLLLATGRERLQVDPIPALAIGALLGWTGISFLWADDPGMCLRRLIVLACSAVGALGIARRLSVRDLNWLTILILGSHAVIGVLAELSLGTFRPWADDYRFSGTVHPNTQGPALCAVCLAALGLARAIPARRWQFAAVFAVALVLLILTKSRTSTAAVLLAIGVVFAVQTSFRLKAVACLTGVWLTCLALWLLFVVGMDPITDFRDALLLGRADESDTLSGRAFIWPEVAHFIGQRFWLGYGYESFWTPQRIDIISENLGWGLREAHNAYLEMLLSLGLVGLVLMLVVVAASFIASLRGYLTSCEPTYALPLGMLVFGLFNAGLESGIVAIETLTFILACCLLRMAFFSDRGTAIPTTDK